MDTGNDPRLALLDRALQDTKRIFDRGGLRAQYPKGKAAEACQRGHAALMVLRYAYQPPEQLKAMPQFAELVGIADEIEAILGGADWPERIKEDPLAVAQVRWFLGNLRSLPARLELEGQALETAVDVVAGRVVSATKHPQADNLAVCRVAAGRALRVVTNDTATKADDQVGVALLPPADLRGVVSEGMFLGAGAGILKDVDAGPDERPAVDEAAYAETRSMVAGYITGK